MAVIIGTVSRVIDDTLAAMDVCHHLSYFSLQNPNDICFSTQYLLRDVDQSMDVHVAFGDEGMIHLT